jgi:aminoglycoside phosphotransferase (APT) family kinase protein
MRDALDWIHSQTGQHVRRSRRLVGGLTSDVRAVTLTSGETLVLRLYPDGSGDGARHVEREAATLERLVHSDLPVPRLVAAKPIGDVPMLLMTRLPGRIWLSPPDFDPWLTQIAQTLAAVHEVPIGDTSPVPSPIDPTRLVVPDWTTRRKLWERTNAVLSKPPDSFPAVFVHSDYQHFNMLWSRSRLSGLIDWVFAGSGHPDADAAHCRLNLAVLFSIDHAERFRVRYETESGRRMDPWWDLCGLTAYGPGWKWFIPKQVAGRAVVDAAGMDDRVEGLMERIHERI